MCVGKKEKKLDCRTGASSLGVSIGVEPISLYRKYNAVPNEL